MSAPAEDALDKDEDEKDDEQRHDEDHDTDADDHPEVKVVVWADVADVGISVADTRALIMSVADRHLHHVDVRISR